MGLRQLEPAIASAKAKAKAKQSHRIMITSSSQEKFIPPAKKPPIPIPIYKAQSRKQSSSVPMEELMMKVTSHQTDDSHTIHQPNITIPSTTTTTTLPTWKLYENPCYTNSNNNQGENHQLKNPHKESTDQQKQIHRLHLPVSARKIATSFWDLTFIKSLMNSELEKARAQINQLKNEVESERRARKKMESLNKMLTKELSEARKGLERVCQEISSDKVEVNRMKEEMQEERKMMRVAEVIREERVQMKLAEAKIFMEERFSDLEKNRGVKPSSSSSEARIDRKIANAHQAFSFGEKMKFILGEKSVQHSSSSNRTVAVVKKKGGYVEQNHENPHIKRGIKGFVEFPKVVKAIGCQSSKHFMNTKLECQKAQLKILLKHKGPVRFNGLIAR